MRCRESHAWQIQFSKFTSMRSGIFKNERYRAAESEDRQHPSRRFGRRWRRRSFNQRDKLFQERRKRANAIASRKLFDGVVAARGRWKSGNAIDRRRILSQGLSEGRSRRGALQRAERLQSERCARSRRRREDGNRRPLGLL